MGTIHGGSSLVQVKEQLKLAVVGIESKEWIQDHFGTVLMQIVDIQCVWIEVLSLTECMVAVLAQMLSIRGERFWSEYVRFEAPEELHVESLVCG